MIDETPVKEVQEIADQYKNDCGRMTNTSLKRLRLKALLKEGL